MTNTLAFRLYGNFQWPPTQLKADNEKKCVRGVVDIWFTKRDSDDNNFRALLRWLPGKLVLSYLSQTPNTDNTTPQVDIAEQRKKAFGEFSESQQVIIWISPKTNVWELNFGDHLRFRGAILFEQYTGNLTVSKQPELRWPLVRNYLFKKSDIEANEYQYSELIIGKNKNFSDTFRFNLALPTPIPQTSNSAHQRPPLFAFTTFYKVVVDKVNDCQKILAITTTTGKGIELSKTTSRLGQKGFTIKPSNVEKFYAFPGPASDYADYWPYGQGKEICHFLKLAGFDTREMEKKPEAFRVPENPDEFDLSINFSCEPSSNSDSSTTFHLDYRVALEVCPGKEIDEGPVKILPDHFFNGESNIFYLLLPHIKGQLLPVAKTIKAYLQLQCVMTEANIKNWLVGLPGAEVYESKLDVTIILWGTDNENGLGLFGSAIDSITNTHAALREISNEQPQSLLPSLAPIKDTKPIILVHRGKKLLYHSKLGQVHDIQPPEGPNLSFPTLLNEKIFTANFLNFSSPGPPENIDIKLKPWTTEAQNIPEGALAIFEITCDKAKNIPIKGRLGALEFESAANWISTSDTEKSYLAILPRPRMTQRIGATVEGQTGEFYKRLSTVGLEMHLRLNISRVISKAVDIARGDRERASLPLLIPPDKVGGTGGNDQPKFILKVTERVTDSEDWRLTAELLDVKASPNDNVAKEPASGTENDVSKTEPLEFYTVLSDEPFSMFRFARRPLSESGDEERADVATFDSDTRTWLFKKASSEYHYVMPSQAVGESTDKPRCLKIVDLPEKKATKTGEGNETDTKVIHPCPNVKESNTTYMVEHRLTPSTELWIKPSDLERGYFLPEWAAHDIFRQRGDFGLGAALVALRGEFLYGLSVSVDTRAESGIARQARVAEIEALTGQLPALCRTPTDVYMANRWKKVRKALKTRQERLELWTIDPNSERPFSPARFEAGVAFALRSTALHRQPIEGKLEISEGQKNRLRFDPHGLPGGALWPLEFLPVIQKLLENPESSGGTLERVALSPTGGDADQKASFLKGILSISSETRGGFIQRQKVEITGRIGALWHRAKHVVVYERTVNPSAQFAPELDTAPQDITKKIIVTRRSVIRKISEYIEILQPQRSYPDNGAAPHATGFLDAVRFNSTIIHVDSAWGREIDAVGYVIPLWNRLSAGRRPQVYPKPDIVFVTRAEGERELATVAQECDDPENLYFFTDVSSGEPNTDKWQSRIGIDGAEMPEADKVLRALEKGDEAQSDARQAAASLVIPGIRRFTWRLLPGGAKTQINAHRGERPIFAGLESISLMRAIPVNEEKCTAQNEALDLLKKLQSIGAQDWEEAQASDLGNNSFANLARKHADFLKTTKDLAATITDNLKDTAENQVKEIIKLLPKEPEKLIKNFFEKFDPSTKIPTLTGLVLKAEKPDFERLTNDLFAGISRKRLLIHENLSAWQNLPVSDVWPNHLPGDIKKYKENITNNLSDSLEKHLVPIFAGTCVPVDQIYTGVEQVRAVLRDTQCELQQDLRRTLARIDSLGSVFNAEKPWSGNRLKQFCTQLRTEWSSITTAAENAIEEAKERMALEVNGMANSLVSSLIVPLSNKVLAVVGVEHAFNESVSEAAVLIAPFNFSLNKLYGAEHTFDTIYDHIESISSAVENSSSQLNNFKNAVTDLKSKCSEIKTLKDKIESVSLEEKEELIGKINDLSKEIEKLDTILKKLSINTLALDGIIHSDPSVKEHIGKLKEISNKIKFEMDPLLVWKDKVLTDYADIISTCIEAAKGYIIAIIQSLNSLENLFQNEIWNWCNRKKDALDKILTELDPNSILKNIKSALINPRIAQMLEQIPSSDYDNIENLQKKVAEHLGGLVESLTGVGGVFASLKGVNVGDITDACDALSSGFVSAYESIGNTCAGAKEQFKKLLSEYNGHLNTLENDNEILIRELSKKVKGTEETLRETVNSVTNIVEQTKLYTRRLLEASSNISAGGATAVPGNVLRLYSAVTSAPELALLQANTDRIRCCFNEFNNTIDTTKAKAYFARLGDSMKALGLELPFNGLSDTFKIDDDALKNFELSRLFRNFGGLKLDGLFKGVRLPPDVASAIRVSHDFDKKQARAWVQIDINVPVSGRREFFAVGPFAMYFRDSILKARVKLEASKDAEKVEESGFAQIVTTIDAVVAGQSVVSLEKTELNYSREAGLKFSLNPQNIKLNQVFKFIQDTLSGIFPDEIGGLTIVKERGIPVGVEHDFSMPNMSFVFGTSGVSNIQISNRFRLIAFPDFIVANRFNLSRPEMPFLFTVFVIGGTGYIQVDTEYRPFDKRLMVVVTAAVGGCAALGFAFGPVIGSVFITLSVELSYRWLNNSGGGLAVSLLLVIAGNVSLWGIVHIFLCLALRMTYRDNGQIDAQGVLRVEVRISRFFRPRYHTTVNYKLRGGSNTTRSSSAKAKAFLIDSNQSWKEAIEKAKMLNAARS